MKFKIKTLIFVAATGLVLSSCGASSIPFNDEEAKELAGDIPTQWVDYSVPASSITFAEGEEDLTLNKGDKYTYSFTASPKDANVNSFEWASDNESVAKVAAGVVNAVGGGQASIDVSSNGNSLATLSVKVNSPLQALESATQSLDLGYGESAQVNVTYSPVDTTELGYSYKIENEEYATVSSEGLVTAKYLEDNGEYTTNLVVKSDVNDQIKLVIPVKVSDKVTHVTGVSIINKEVTNIEVNHELQLGANVLPEGAQDKGLVWSSSNEDVARVNENGKVVAGKAEGDATITVASNEKPELTDSIDLHVYEVKAASFTVDSTSLAFSNTGSSSHQISISYFDADFNRVVPSYTEPSFVSSNPSVAAVSSTGLVTMVGTGDAVISVSDAKVTTAAFKVDINVNVEIQNIVTVTGYPEWIGMYGATLFAWAWGGEAGEGQWYPITLDGTSGTFVPPKDITGFNMVRCAMGTTEPDWKIGDDRPGRIYNKTADIDAFPGIITYASPEWDDYSYEEDPLNPDTILDYYVVGDFNNWTKDDFYKLDRVEAGHYQFASIDFLDGAEFKIFEPSNNAYITNASAWNGCGFTLAEGGNIVVTEGATYAIDFYPNSPYGNPITIMKGGAPVPVVASEYQVKIGTDKVDLEPVSDLPVDAPANLIAIYEATVPAIYAGGAFSFYGDDELINSKIGPNDDDTKNSIYNNFMYGEEDGLYKFQNDATDALVQLNVYTNGNSFWVSGGDSEKHGKIVVPSFLEGVPYIVGNRDYSSGTSASGSSWGNPAQALVAESYDVDVPTGVSAQFKATVTFAKDDEFKVLVGENYWDATYEEGGAIPEMISQSGSSNCVVKKAGTYDIYIKDLGDNGWRVYIGEPSQEPITPASEYKFQLGSSTVELVPVDISELGVEGLVARYEANVPSLTKDTVFSFLADDVAISEHIGPNADDLTHEYFNNYVKQGATYKIQANAENALVQLSVYNDGYSFWIAGGDSKDHEVAMPKYDVNFSADLSTFKAWASETSDFSLYLYGPEGDVAGSWNEVKGNLDTGSLTLKVEEGKTVTGAVFYLYEDGELKQSKDILMEPVISEAGDYTVSFGEMGWEEDPVGSTVWKMTGVTIIKDGYVPMSIDKNVANILVDANEVITVSNAAGTIVAESDDNDIATAAVNENKVTITGVAAGSAKVTISDGTSSREVVVTVSENPAEQIYQVKIGENTYDLELDPDAEHTGDYADRTALYTVSIPQVTAGQAVEFSLNGEDIEFFALAGGNNNIVEVSSAYQIKDSSDTAVTLYLNVWKPNVSEEVWVTAFLDGAEPVESSMYITGLGGVWTVGVDEWKMTAVDENHYQITGINVAAGDKVKVVDQATNTWYGNANSWDLDLFTVDGDGNVVLVDAGVYTFDFYVNGDNGNHIVPTRTGDAPIVPEEMSIDKNVANLAPAETEVVTVSNASGDVHADSSNIDVATVSVNGNKVTITAVADGNATVTITDDDEGSKTVQVTVSSVVPEKVTITLQTKLNAGLGNRAYLVGDFSSWKINDKAVAFQWDDTYGGWVAVVEVDKGTSWECKVVSGLYENPAEEPIGWLSASNENLEFTETKTITLS